MFKVSNRGTGPVLTDTLKERHDEVAKLLIVKFQEVVQSHFCGIYCKV